ncbi:hypothetical protein [Streptomyces sp. NPDC055189]
MSEDLSLAALGLDVVPALRPLAYPGRPAPWPALLTGDDLLPLGVCPLPLGQWLVAGRTLDEVLGERGQAPVGRRHPVIAVGSNASPAQVAYKLVRRSVPATVPMVPVRVRGIAVGCSAHIGRAGYVAAAPYLDDPAAETSLVVSWLDGDQFRAVDETEFPNYRRALLPGGDFAMTMPSGELLHGAFLYVSARGVLTDSGAGPRRDSGHQATLLASLLDASPRLRDLLGPDPASWVRKAAADRAVRESGTRIFGEESWVLRQPGLLSYAGGAAGL